MVESWIVQLLIGTGKLFLHPVFYYAFFLAAILGVSRVKRERWNFHIRAENAYFELRQLLPLGMLLGLCLSLITIGAGLVIPFAAILFTAIWTILLSFTTKIRLLSPVYTLGVAFFVVVIGSNQGWELPFFPEALKEVEESVFPAIALLLALLMIAEGVLIFRNGSKGTSPRLINSKRGQRVGIHEVKRIWMLPLFLVIPGEALSSPFSWWPVFTIADSSYSLLLVPFTIGFHQRIQGMLPKDAIDVLGKRVMMLGILFVPLAAVGYWYPLSSVGVVALAMIGREALYIRHKLLDESLPFFFSKKNHGLMILGIIPESPASKMALQVGEMITKVNGTPVQSETALYEALQRNRAHCKLEVIDVNGQIRFVQRALYEGDHHELGILFVQDKKKWDSAVV
ncbi:PDZ domain-containing protein [Cytobacillus spongiae]|uniref:PDZ domain-containing protein n=1 Tax=Cytobacillus spongiae TaxID=2901381 RepID=UPI001F471A4D|nr:PDZ domain-containing protein [Cytobacillus spongiae]UII55592.1 PDZ domain-containing protein [Cytobacillus spongiae]